MQTSERAAAANDKREWRRRRQMVTCTAYSDKYVYCDSVCLSHDMQLTHSLSVYRQWVAAGWSHPFSHSHLPHNGLVDSSIQCHQWLQQRSPSADVYICQELVPLRSGVGPAGWGGDWDMETVWRLCEYKGVNKGNILPRTPLTHHHTTHLLGPKGEESTGETQHI